jgi:hypothetical protein
VPASEPTANRVLPASAGMRSRPIWVVSVAELFVRLGSVSPGATATVAVFVSRKLVLGKANRLAKITTLPPTGMFAPMKKSFAPLDCVTDAPPDV